MSVPEIDVDEAARRRQAGTPVVDVREPHEYVEGHVPGAVLIPLGELAHRVGELPAGEVLLVCRSGARSRRAAEHLLTQGVQAVNVGGGTIAWIEAGHPVVAGEDPGH
ncbi:MAG TPA: rhodanese-like domain-containing protein [Acidimicrobiales bacterium]|nr:rhodanese-like domain-containing protein [Acidimicrobiales bacterium]HRA34964.1 rhodanese-like domain-containing protein [Acidimicrobiales bacterium]